MNNLQLAQTTTDPVILDELSRDEDWYFRCRVAQNPNTTPETLDYLSKDKNSWVRCRVAQNPNTTPETLDYLSKDKNASVRWRVVQNPNTTPETLDYLSKDKVLVIQDGAKSNPNYPNIFKRIKMFFNKLNNTPIIKKVVSFNQIIPSENMDEEEYNLFLNLATILELESNIVTKETYYKICKELNRSIPRPVLPHGRVL